MLFSVRVKQPSGVLRGACSMRRSPLYLILVALLALLLPACGGNESEDVPNDAIAIVGGREIPKKDFDSLIAQAKRSYEAQKRDFPKVGTPQYTTLKNQAVQFLVQRAQFEIKADELDVDVTSAEISKRLDDIKKQYFGGNDKRYRDQLKQQGLTEDQVQKDIRAQLIQEELFQKVTADVKVSDKEIQDYYNKNKAQYGEPESREIRHILVSSKLQADKLYKQLKAGASFAALAKKYSKDPGSKDQGGKLTIARGQTVAPFDQTAFLLPKGALSRPVKTQYGYHLIEALSEVKSAKSTPLSKVKPQIKQQLLQTERNDTMTKWVEDTQKGFEDDTRYQVGFKPPAEATVSTLGTSTSGN
jgi:parvulin-like peptidyl-prolyl isomerase